MSDEATPARAGHAAPGVLRIGLTGPIGCGKSTVAGWLGELGAVVIDADTIAHQVTGPGEPATEVIFARFGEPLRLPDGSLDRAALGRRVFASPADLAALEAIVHPAVRPRILGAIAAAEASGAPAVVVEAIKLVEGGLAELCDEVWLVTCAPAEQRARLLARGMAPEDADRRIAAQGNLADRLAPLATRVIDTSGSRFDARERVEDALLGALRVEDSIASVAECRSTLSEPARERLRRVVLAAVDGRDRREFRAYVRLACVVDSPSLREELRSRLAGREAIRRHARWVLEGLGERV